MKKILIAGCGKVGKLISYFLSQDSDYILTVVDQNADNLRDLQNLMTKIKSLKTICADFADLQVLSKIITQNDYVLSAAPYYINRDLAQMCYDQKVHYLDLTEDVETTKFMQNLAHGASVVFIPQCGLAPGFISISAQHLTQNFEKLDSVRLRVGALPLYPRNRLKYYLSWSTEGLINEYANPCETIRNGQLFTALPLEGYERFVIDGIEYEAFNTSGGLGTLAQEWQEKVNELDYKSIRYPGHCELIRFLMEDLKLRDDKNHMKELFERAMPYSVQDVVVIYVSATGLKDKRYIHESMTKKIYNQHLGDVLWGGIQITTAASACAVLDLLVEGKLKTKGFMHQHEIPFPAFVNNRFGRYFNAENEIFVP